MRETQISRDHAVRRLRRTTSLLLTAAGALVAAFAGLAARALPGHHTVKAGTPVRTSAKHVAATPPPLIAAQSSATPAAPAAPPVQTQAPPVVVSGGT
ncbi:MAG TPA: hypothetical protein VIG35_04060 [Gaiellaceae bacterium]